jgi:hypothetical protein
VEEESRSTKLSVFTLPEGGGEEGVLKKSKSKCGESGRRRALEDRVAKTGVASTSARSAGMNSKQRESRESHDRSS